MTPKKDLKILQKEEVVTGAKIDISIKEILPIFNPDTGLTYQEWRNLFERIVKLQSISEKDALSMIPSIFEGKALEIYASMCQDVFTLGELHQAMNTFFPVSTSGLMKQFLTEKKLPSQPLMDYYFNKLKLAKILNISSEQTLEALSSNVNAKLRPFLIAANPANLDMWIKIASSLEKGFRHEETSSPFNGPRYRRDFQNIDSRNATPSQDSLPSGARPGREVGDRQETRRKQFYQDFRGDKVLYKIPYQSGQETIEIDKPCQPENKHATIVNISKVKLWDPVTEDNTEPPFPFQEEEDLEGCLGVEPNKQASTDSPQNTTTTTSLIHVVQAFIFMSSVYLLAPTGGVDSRTISRRLVANGLHSCRPLRRLPLTPPNRRQRLEWCRARSTWMTEWHRVVFSDESRFCLSSDSRRVRVWRRRGERSNPAAIVERPTVRQRGIMVWGAIAYDSRSPLLRIQGTMTAQRYVDDVLRPVTLPYLQGVPNALYQQDNARPHTARISQQALQDVQMLPWPPYSPDLSPIEHVWDIIGRRLHALPQPRSEDELWQMVEREWRAIPQDAIRTLIDSLPRRVAACIAVRGGPTCY
ncbi:Transposase [Cordylochernes scorpioides]|uniref:Transposase n=1 Tax=Cordylochernes scorpioides TaxID=51811 RepID=A0ABY6K8A4_9ARAC|nr:Transposase [Cordylochernes scorpioides]